MFVIIDNINPTETGKPPPENAKPIYTKEEILLRDQQITAQWKKVMQEALQERDNKWKLEIKNIVDQANAANNAKIQELEENNNKVLKNLLIELKTKK